MKIILRAALFAALTMSWGLSWGQAPFLDTVTLNVSFGCPTSNGSTYEIWLYDDTSPSKPWEDAQAFAEGRELRGAEGHLATFESAAEEACVLEQAAGLEALVHPDDNRQLWIGLVQDLEYECEYYEECYEDLEPDGGWGWVTGEAFSYVNWASNEPNNAGGDENHGTIGRYGYATDPNAGWNDEDPGRGSLFGLVVEYDVAALGEVVLECGDGACLIEIPSANPERNTIIIPGDGGTADIGVFLIEENCSAIAPSRVTSREVSFGPDGESIDVPDYLCADQWILISSELGGISILEGVVEAEFEPGDFGIAQNGCATEFTPQLLDPLLTDLLAYLPGNGQWGNVGGFLRSAPWMQEVTYDCDSSRGRMRGNQYFGIGLNFNLDGDVTNELILLTRDKVGRLEEWVNDAVSGQVIGSRDGILLLRTLQGVIRDIDAARYSTASLRMAYFDAFLGRTAFNAANAGGLNYEGEGISRSSNVRHMIDAYILPLTSLP